MSSLLRLLKCAQPPLPRFEHILKAQFSIHTTPQAINGSSVHLKESHNSQHTADADELKPPERPVEGECCGSGCQNCVWVNYWEALEDYERAKKRRMAQRQEHGEIGETVADRDHLRADAEGATATTEKTTEKGEEPDLDMDPSMKAFLELERRLKGKQ